MRLICILAFLCALNAPTAPEPAGQRDNPVLFPVRQQGLWGYIDVEGDIVIEPRFDYALDFREGLASVGIEGKAGYIDHTGRFVIEPVYDRARSFSGGAALVETGGETGYIDCAGEFIYGPDKDSKRDFSSGLGCVRRRNPTGSSPDVSYLDIDGEVALVWDRIKWGEPPNDFHDGIAAFSRDGLWGIVNTEGSEVIPPTFRDMPVFLPGGLVRVTDKNRESAVIDKTGKEVFRLRAGSIRGYGEGMFKVCTREGTGFVNGDSEWVIEPVYSTISDFSEGHAIAWRDRRAFVLNLVGEETETSLHEHFLFNRAFPIGCTMYPFKDGLAKVVVRRRAASIDHDGGITTLHHEPVNCGTPVLCDSITCLKNRIEISELNGESPFGHYPDEYFSEGMARHYDWPSKLVGFTNRENEIVIAPAWDEARNFSEGLAAVRRGLHWGFINKTGEVAVEPAWDDAGQFYEQKVRVMKSGKWGFINDEGEVIVPCQYEEIGDFSEGLAGVRWQGKWGFIGPHGVTLIPPTYESVLPFSEGLAAAAVDGKWGFIDKLGRFAISPEYDHVYGFSDGLALVGEMPEMPVLIGRGKALIPLRQKHDSPTRFFVFPREKSGRYRFVDKRGETVFEDEIYWFFGPFQEGRARVIHRLVRSQYGAAGMDYIDRSGRLVTNTRFMGGGEFENGEALVVLPETVAYVNTEGELVWPPTY